MGVSGSTLNGEMISQFYQANPDPLCRFIETSTLAMAFGNDNSAGIDDPGCFEMLLLSYLTMLDQGYRIHTDRATPEGTILFFRKKGRHLLCFDLIIVLKVLQRRCLRIGTEVPSYELLQELPREQLAQLRVVSETSETSDDDDEDDEPEPEPSEQQKEEEPQEQKTSGRPSSSKSEGDNQDKSPDSKRRRKVEAGVSLAEYQDNAWVDAFEYTEEVSNKYERLEGMKLATLLIICVGHRRIECKVARGNRPLRI